MVGAVSQDIVNREPIAGPAIIGKLPAHGDFIARGVDFAWREPLDRWMSDWIECARAELADDFDDAYLSAAPWIFEGERTHAVLMPSADAVGRLFPLLAIAGSEYRSQAIYDQLVEALSIGTSGDDLMASLAAIELECNASNDNPSGWFLPEGAEQKLPSPDAVDGWADVAGCFA